MSSKAANKKLFNHKVKQVIKKYSSPNRYQRPAWRKAKKSLLTDSIKHKAFSTQASSTKYDNEDGLATQVILDK